MEEDLCQQSVIENRMLCRFVEDRIKSNKCSIWSLMKKRKLNTWKSTTKTLKIKIKENVIELKEDRLIFARMCVVAKSRPEIDLKDVSLSLKSATRLARQGAQVPVYYIRSPMILTSAKVPGHPQSVSMRSLVNSPHLPVTNVVF